MRRLKAEGFSDPAMLDWTFENDTGRSPQMHYAHRYVEQWQTMRSENLGLLLWGGVGTGKSFLAGCIANALMEQEVPVRMTNFARILNELNSSFSGLDDLIEQLSVYIQSTGRKYADHAATLRIWVKRQKPEPKQAPGIPDYTFKEGESL